jgi:hypothetical protein
MLQQLHYQFKDGHTEFIAQNDITNHDEFRTWLEDVNQNHPLPDGAQWLVCNEDSEYFVWTEEVYDCPVHGKCGGADGECPRC